MADADLLSLGQHCSAEECHQLDFLPFDCDACGKVFCLDHRSYKAHRCSKAAGRESTVIVCPLCAKSVRLTPGQDPNVAFEAHSSKDCDPSNYARVHRKLKCPVPGCKEKLTSINTYNCKTCCTAVCMKHRFPSDHDCSSRKAEAARSRRPVASAVRSFLRMGSGKAASPAPPAKREAPVQASAKSSASAAAKAAAEAAERRNNPSSRAQLVNPPATSGDGSAAAFSQHTAERCPQCGAAFKTLQELLFHVEAFHPDGAASSAPAAGIERCPDCGQSFANAVTLVEHVERNHARKQLCVLC